MRTRFPAREKEMEMKMGQGQALQMAPSPPDVAQEIVTTGHAAPVSPQEAGGGNVDKIRDILFGVQMREYESRFVRLEDNVAKELADIRETSRKRSDAIESYLRNEFDSLQARLKNEREDRTAGSRQLARDLSELGETLRQKMGEFEEQTASSHRQFRLELLELSKTFSSDLSRKQDEVTALLERRFQELRKGKTDRASLATLLTEMSMKLNADFAAGSSGD
jgi:hypothetical protein